MKKILLVVFIIILLLVSLVFYKYTSSYAIKDNKENLENNIKLRIHRTTDDLDIKQSINIDNKKYVLYIISNELGVAEFTKGFNKRYKIGSTSYGNNPIKYNIVKTNKAKYFIIAGKNTEKKINYVKLLLENTIYKIDIPQQEYFYTFCKIPNNTMILYPEISDLSFYNSNNKSITKEVLSQ
ncbi:hypothetical protein QA584_24510 [Anaerocolumna sp. AGMB13025]|uniref:hypothetical protein n=1 Tax=Anaerocolumna sp. AGMB13025 TaxID=3039116 RepID=UPI00241CDE06|nr:hypothetical protein [Anaerocolumna sp. AGMB13025]WFR56739.1 hypothetical protein QA584_24510 [Anaerocolumna sp. AGMB13025]